MEFFEKCPKCQPVSVVQCLKLRIWFGFSLLLNKQVDMLQGKCILNPILLCQQNSQQEFADVNVFANKKYVLRFLCQNRK